MKINSPELRGSGGVQKRKASDTKKAPEGASTGSQAAPAGKGGDKVSISNSPGQMQNIRSNLKGVPDIRAEKVAAVKADIEAGRYHPSAHEIADAMIREVQKYAG